MTRTRSGRNFRNMAAQAPAVPAVPPAFALTPGVLDLTIIDYDGKAGKKLFEAATRRLGETFDGSSDKLMVLQEELTRKATNFGWNNHDTSDIINIAPIAAIPLTTCNLIQEYSQLSVEVLTAWATANLVNMQTRKAQNNYNMYSSLFNTLDADRKASMALERDSYTIQGTPIAALFYKTLMSKAEVDTQATIALTRTALTRLDQKMLELNSDIPLFNLFVKGCKRKLNNRKADSNDLLINLFTGYKAARDSDFLKTIQDIEKDYLHGKTPTLTDDDLMSQALVAYQVRFESKVWGALSHEQEMIVAMQAKIDGLKDSRLKVDTRSKKKKERKANIPGPEKKKYESDKFDWKNKNARNLKTMAKSGTTYYWCKHHNHGDGMWVTHKLADCRNKARDDRANTNEGEDEDTMANAAIAAMDDDNSSDEDESESEE